MSAKILMMTYPNDGRKLQRLIVAILKQGLASAVQRINYTKTYTLQEGKVKRNEEKIVLIHPTEESTDKLISFIQKQHPSEQPKLIRLPVA